MKTTFLQYILEQQNKNKVYVFFPGAFKPPTKYHWDVINYYLTKIKADKLFVIISNPKSENGQRRTKEGKVITPEMSKEIFNLYRKEYGIPDSKIEVLISDIPSPISFMFKYIRDNIDNADIIFGTSNKNDDDKKRFTTSFYKVSKTLEDEKENIKFLDPFEYTYKTDSDFGATDLRNNSDNYDIVKKFLPDKISEKTKNEIFKIIQPEKQLVEDGDQPSNSPRVGIEKIPNISNIEAKRMFTAIKDDLLSSDGLKLRLTLKMDGQAIRIAWDNENVYAETSYSGMISNPDEMPLEQFKEVLKYLQKEPIKEKLQKILKQTDNGFGIKLFGELLYNDAKYRDDKSITFVGTEYDSTKLGNLATIVLFGVRAISNGELVKVDDNLRDTIIQYMIKNVSDKNLNFIDNNSYSGEMVLKIDDFSIDNQDNIKKIDELHNVKNKNAFIALKDELNYLILKQLEKISKPEIIKNKKSLEGLVFKINDKKYAVQNPEWLNIKSNFYKYISNFDGVVMNFIKEITGYKQRKKILSIWDSIETSKNDIYKKLLPQFKKDLQKVYDDFNNNKKQMPTFVYLNNKNFVDTIYSKFINLTDDIQTFRTALENKTGDVSVVTEGGNIFKDKYKTDRINQENVSSTINDVYENILKVLSINPKDTALLGSTGKKNPGGTSGDLDLAVDITKTKYKSAQELLHAVYDIATEKLGLMASHRDQFHLCSVRFPINNADGKQPDKFVQLDIMPTDNLDMMKFGMFSPHENESKYKGAVRNALIGSIASQIDRKIIETGILDGEEVETYFEKYVFNPQEGLYRYVKSRKGKSERRPVIKNSYTVSKRFITGNPVEIAKIIFGANCKPNKLLSVETVYEEFKKTKEWKNTEIRDRILINTILHCNKKKLDYPDVFKTDITNKELLKKVK